MELIHIDRVIYKELKTEDLKKRFIKNSIPLEYEDYFDINELNYIVNGIHFVIENNDKLNEEYGTIQKNGLKQIDENSMIPAFRNCGYYHSTGKLVICPFDWSWDENGDFNYTFYIAKSL